ncbi:hypothetical protein [Nonomuraea insulae]|uniref:Uncharacterized protein n=1 Tax=Nonomuraea insulae TaxID=1616787 RepID=A0ABW1CVZ3_9ACTN
MRPGEASRPSRPRTNWPSTCPARPAPTTYAWTSWAGDEVYGACTRLCTFLDERGQAYVLRIRATFILGGGTCLTCEQIVAKYVLAAKRKWTVRSAGAGSKGERTYAWAWIASASPAHYLLIRKHRTTGELAFHYCFVPDDQSARLPRLIAAAGRR